MKLLTEYLEVKTQLNALKAREMELRKKLIGPMLAQKLEGTVSQMIDGYKVAGTAVINRKIDPAVLDSIWAEMSEGERDAVRFKPELVLSNYRQLEARGSILMQAVTSTPGTPSIKLEYKGEAE